MSNSSLGPEEESDDGRIIDGKNSWLRSEYPEEDVVGTDMFQPFFKRKRTLHVGLSLLLAALCYFFLPLNPEHLQELGLTEDKVRTGLTIFTLIGALWLTEAMPLSATALLVPVLATLTGLSDMKTSMSNFAHPLIFIFFGGFALAAAMAYQGIDRWVAERLIRLGKGHFIRSSILLFGATAMLTMWMSNTATAAMMVPIVIGIIRALPPEAASNVKNNYFLLLGIAYSASIGGMGTLVGSPPNGIAASALDLSFVDWLKFGIPAVLIMLPLMVWLLVILCRPSKGIRIPTQKTVFRFNNQRRITLLIFLLTAGGWIFSGSLSQMAGVKSDFDTIVALVAVFMMLLFRVVRWRDIDEGIEWGVLLLFGGGIALSAVLGSSGASTFLADALKNLIGGWSGFGVALAVTFFVIMLTELSSNTATAALLVPIFMTVAVAMGMSSESLVIPLALASSCAFMLPVATPPNAIVFATKRIPQREMMRVGIVLNLVFSVALAIYSKLFLM